MAKDRMGGINDPTLTNTIKVVSSCIGFVCIARTPFKALQPPKPPPQYCMEPHAAGHIDSAACYPMGTSGTGRAQANAVAVALGAAPVAPSGTILYACTSRACTACTDQRSASP